MGKYHLKGPKDKMRIQGKGRREDKVKEDVKKINPGVDWKEGLLDRENWRPICWTACS